MDFMVFVKSVTPDSRARVFRRMQEDPQFNIWNADIVSNSANLLYFKISTYTIDEMMGIIEDLWSFSEVESVSVETVLEEFFFNTWMDKMIDEMNYR